MGGTVSLIDIGGVLRKRWNIIVLIILVATLISIVSSYFLIKPVFQASTQILVNQKNADNQLDYSLLQSNVDLISTYSGVIKSPVILEKVINKLSLNYSWEELNNKITITNQKNSQIFTLTVKDGNYAKAVEIANTISETFQVNIKNIMSVDNVSILAQAELKENPVPISPKPILNIAIAIVIGLLAGMALALLVEMMDNTLKNDEDVAACLGVPVLGEVQVIPHNQKRRTKASAIPLPGGEAIVKTLKK